MIFFHIRGFIHDAFQFQSKMEILSDFAKDYKIYKSVIHFTIYTETKWNIILYEIS